MSELYPPTEPPPSAAQVSADAIAASEALAAAAATVDLYIDEAVSGTPVAAVAIDNIEVHFVKVESALATLRAVARAARRISLQEPPHGAT
jgi:hypothetical protein